MSPEEVLDRREACQILRISRQTLLVWIRKGKLKVWKRAGRGSNAALLFHRRDIERLLQANGSGFGTPKDGSNGDLELEAQNSQLRTCKGGRT